MEDHPFDKPHCIVSVSFPLEYLARSPFLGAQVDKMSEERGGTQIGPCVPLPEFAGREGYKTFGFAVAFEAGDANTEGFIGAVAEGLAAFGVTTEFNPEDITYPAEPERASTNAFSFTSR